MREMLHQVFLSNAKVIGDHTTAGMSLERDFAARARHPKNYRRCLTETAMLYQFIDAHRTEYLVIGYRRPLSSRDIYAALLWPRAGGQSR
jgi:hypothetical protein